MNKILNHKYIIVWVVVGLTIQSCSTLRKDYERPSMDEVNLDLYRTEKAQTDSTNLAAVAWQYLFTDPILQSHIETTLAQNLDLQVALENIKSANSYLLQAKAGNFPVVSVGPSVTYSSSSLNTQFGGLFGDRQYIDQYELSGTLSWEADIWGKISSRKKSQLALYLQSVSAQQAIQSQLVASITSSYYQLLSLDEQQKVLEEAITLRSNSLETAKALKEAGQLTEAAVKQYEAQVYNAQAQLVNTKNSIAILENTMCVLMGEAPHAIERSSLESQQINSEYLKVGVPAQLLENRPDVIAAEYDLVNAFELTNVAKASMYPSLTISGSGGLQGIDLDEFFSAKSLFFNVVGSLTQPIWNQRQLKTQKEVALNNQQIAYLNYKNTILKAGKEVANALNTYETQSQLFDLKQKEYTAYNQSKDYSQELLNYGMSNYLDVLVAEQNELSAKLGTITAQYGKLNAVVELYRSLGGGWE